MHTLIVLLLTVLTTLGPACAWSAEVPEFESAEEVLEFVHATAKEYGLSQEVESALAEFHAKVLAESEFLMETSEGRVWVFESIRRGLEIGLGNIDRFDADYFQQFLAQASESLRIIRELDLDREDSLEVIEEFDAATEDFFRLTIEEIAAADVIMIHKEHFAPEWLREALELIPEGNAPARQALLAGFLFNSLRESAEQHYEDVAQMTGVVYRFGEFYEGYNRMGPNRLDAAKEGIEQLSGETLIFFHPIEMIRMFNAPTNIFFGIIEQPYAPTEEKHRNAKPEEYFMLDNPQWLLNTSLRMEERL